MVMLGRDSQEKMQARDDGGSRGLVVIVACLGFLILVLGGVVVVNYLNTEPSTDDDTELNYDDTESKKISAKMDEYSGLYSKGKHEEALAGYQKQMDEALAEEDYDKYLRVFSSRDMALIYYDGCEDILRAYDNLKLDALPVGTKLNILGTAAVTSNDCGDTERGALYESELERIIKEEGVEQYDGE